MSKKTPPVSPLPLEEMAIAVADLMLRRFGLKGEAYSFETSDVSAIRFDYRKVVNARSLVLDLLQQGLTHGALAKQVSVHPRTIYSWLHGAEPKPHRVAKLRDLHTKKVRALDFVVGAHEW